jgi:hypothetical protein
MATSRRFEITRDDRERLGQFLVVSATLAVTAQLPGATGGTVLVAFALDGAVIMIWSYFMARRQGLPWPGPIIDRSERPRGWRFLRLAIWLAWMLPGLALLGPSAIGTAPGFAAYSIWLVASYEVSTLLA